MKLLKLLFLVLLLTSCGSRKKALDKSSEKNKTETAKQVDSVVKNDVEKNSNRFVQMFQEADEAFNEFYGKLDSTGVGKVNTKMEPDGSITKTYKGFESVKETNNKKRSSTTNEIKETQSETDRSTIDLSTKEQVKEQSESESKVLNVERESNPFTIFWIIIALAVVGYIGYHIYKKSNPLASVLDKIKGWIG